eukprot:TRINITY_DN1096_c0_g1_i9.p1 TRINITY_DN1096_c0_g1~~TRINITY_DN1096_c0_g1_i9.p1  ORF type:complete len:1001 (-),score=234.06 TRINITY_DN1096_c0_g1_i9:65-3067(-)
MCSCVFSCVVNNFTVVNTDTTHNRNSTKRHFVCLPKMSHRFKFILFLFLTPGFCPSTILGPFSRFLMPLPQNLFGPLTAPLCNSLVEAPISPHTPLPPLKTTSPPLTRLSGKELTACLKGASLLGTGGLLGETWRALITKECGVGADRVMAVKKIRPQRFAQSFLDALDSEATILSKLCHENIVPVCGVCSDSIVCCLSPFVEGYPLDTYKKTPVLKDTTVKVGIVVEIMRAFEYLHKNDVIHGSFKPSDVILDSSLHVHVRDFGFCAQKQSNFKECHALQPPEYTPPEAFFIHALPWSKAGDVFSWSVVAWELFEGGFPFGKPNDPPPRDAAHSASHVPRFRCTPDVFAQMFVGCAGDSHTRPKFETMLIAISKKTVEELTASARVTQQASQEADAEKKKKLVAVAHTLGELLRAESETANVKALKAIHTFCSTPKATQELISTGTVFKDVVACLNSVHFSVVEATLKALLIIATHKDISVHFEGESFDDLVRLLSSRTQETLVPTLELTSRVIAKTDVLKQRFFASGGMRTVISLLSTPDNDEIVYSAVKLCTAILDQRLVQDEMFASGAVGLIVDFIDKIGASPQLQFLSLVALAQLLTNERTQDMVVGMGVCEKLLDLLCNDSCGTGPTTNENHITILHLAATFTACEAVVDVLDGDKWVSRMSELLVCATAPQHKKIRKYACITLANLVRTEDDAATANTLGVMPVLCGSFAVEGDKLLPHALRLLGKLLYYPECRDEFRGNDGLHGLLHVLLVGAHAGTPPPHCFDVLVTLAYAADWALALLTHPLGGLTLAEPLVSMLRSGGGRTRLSVAQLLRLLVSYEQAAPLMEEVVQSGLTESLLSILRNSDTDQELVTEVGLVTCQLMCNEAFRAVVGTCRGGFETFYQLLNFTTSGELLHGIMSTLARICREPDVLQQIEQQKAVVVPSVVSMLTSESNIMLTLTMKCIIVLAGDANLKRCLLDSGSVQGLRSMAMRVQLPTLRAAAQRAITMLLQH